jgi:hypothetical protein
MSGIGSDLSMGRRLARLAWGVATTGLVVFGGWLLYATTMETLRLTRVEPPKPPEIRRDVLVKNVADREGKRASFRILLFTDEFRWRLNSFDSLDTQPARPVFTEEMKQVLNQAEEIICIGASSEELPAGMSAQAGRQAEEWRAARRAEQIAMWVRQAVSKPVPIRKLNVGHHASTGRPSDTADQRRVVIILVLDHDKGVNIDQALRAAMATESVRAPIFEALLTRYSLASGEAFTWVP